MPVFLYHGQSRQGRRRRGEITAKDSREASRLLRKQEILATSIREKPAPISLSLFSLTSLRVKPRALVVLTLQLATMVKAGVPLLQGLQTVARHSTDQTLQETLNHVAQQVQSGNSLGASLRAHPQVFSPWYVGMVEAGEASGMLDVTLQRLADSLEKRLKLTHQVRAALAYPCVVLVVALSVLAVLVMWVIPMFGPLFTDLGDALPWPTKWVLQVSAFMNSYILFLLSLGVGVGFLMKRLLRSEWGQTFRERLLLKIPLMGTVWLKTSVVHFARTLSGLLKSGVPILEGLTLAGRTSGLRRLEHALGEAQRSVGEGHSLADPLLASGVFPPFVTEMVRVGESTGSLDSTLEKVADLYEQEVNRDIVSLTALIEPLIIVVLGIGIGFIVMAMYLPIFNMASVIG
ncbi:type II secretion system F family protein [Candidatus Nitronereus thalassa]|uniref:General secretion pathway protein F n=1 Tax=Candidatus Nitronereus thalassa TaxID=3020898 RepID=A0ABU3K7E5_9BACT|nr:type II secretion system F family protein [Candidatus Nitronereus thalassa]MDT7042342.1 type II secretion system F family protein [Candidatus Nitronereus thalassa]